MDKRFQVFISSTFADLKDERAKVSQALMEIDCIPAGMELFPAIDQEQFEFIKKIIDDCDYYLLVVGGRYGSISDEGISYTEKEFDYAVAKGIKVIAFLHKNPGSISLDKSEKSEDSRQKLEEFRTKVANGRLVKFWENADELPGLVAMNIPKTIKTYPAIGWVRADTLADPSIYKELNQLKKENLELKALVNIKTEKEISFINELADFDDEIELKGSRSFYLKQRYGTQRYEWSLKISWKALFALIAPYLIECPSDIDIKKTISRQVFNLTEDADGKGTVEIDDQDFQTIKIHLKSLGLIDYRMTKTNAGGMALFWYLTPLGEEYLINLRSVRRLSKD